jgi:Uma2 family endonuclease
MSTSAIVSVEEYLRMSCEPACEYIDGVLRPKSMGTINHGSIQARSCELLKAQGYRALPEITVRLTPTKYLIPDVIADRKLEGPYPTRPALLVIEVLSPGDRLDKTLAKCEDYHAWGTPYCWVIDPEKEIAWDFPKCGEPVTVDRQGTLRAGDIAISMDELFA